MNNNNLYPQFAAGKYVVVKLPYWTDMDMFGITGSWSRDWVFQTARIELHNWCEDFNYKIRLVPVGEYENIGVDRSWYTSDMFGKNSYQQNDIHIFDTIEEAENYRKSLLN